MMKQNTDEWIVHKDEPGSKTDHKASNEKHNWENTDKIKI